MPPPDEGDPDAVPGIVFRAGDRLPVGVEAFAGFEPNDLVLWVESHRVVVAGDTLVDRGSGLELPGDWLREGVRSRRSRKVCVRSSSCRSSTCSRPTEARSTAMRSRALSQSSS